MRISNPTCGSKINSFVLCRKGKSRPLIFLYLSKKYLLLSFLYYIYIGGFTFPCHHDRVPLSRNGRSSPLESGDVKIKGTELALCLLLCRSPFSAPEEAARSSPSGLKNERKRPTRPTRARVAQRFDEQPCVRLHRYPNTTLFRRAAGRYPESVL